MTKSSDAFAVSRASRDGRQARCRACWSEWYQRNRGQHLADDERDLRVLDFDHEDRAGRPRDVARLASMNVAWERIAAEIAKCSVRCANCHRRRTAEQLGYWRHDAELRRRVDLRVAAQHRLTALLTAG